MSVMSSLGTNERTPRKSERNPKDECKELQVNELQEESERNPKDYEYKELQVNELNKESEQNPKDYECK